MQIITLTTDFGLSDPFVGVMKGVILTIAPEATLVDLTHQIPPQDILAGALALESAVYYFPPGTIHLAVIDPGVGSDRRPIAIQTDSALFVGPDNGIFSLVLKERQIRRAVSLKNPRYRLPQVSATFHGRDIFAPAAAHLALGVDLSALGPPADSLVELEIQEPEATESELRGIVLAADHFGNLITSITESALRIWLASAESVVVKVGNRSIGPIKQTYADSVPGETVAYLGSGKRLEIAINHGSAADVHDGPRGTPVTILRG
jgi:S-adenosylmethionine hydrolase